MPFSSLPRPPSRSPPFRQRPDDRTTARTAMEKTPRPETTESSPPSGDRRQQRHPQKISPAAAGRGAARRFRPGAKIHGSRPRPARPDHQRAVAKCAADARVHDGGAGRLSRLISNYLWMRANDLQLDDKYFEARNWRTGSRIWSRISRQSGFFKRGTWPTTSPSSSRRTRRVISPDRWRWCSAHELLRDRACATIRMTLPFTFNSASSFNINRRESRRR